MLSVLVLRPRYFGMCGASGTGTGYVCLFSEPGKVSVVVPIADGLRGVGPAAPSDIGRRLYSRYGLWWRQTLRLCSWCVSGIRAGLLRLGDEISRLGLFTSGTRLGLLPGGRRLRNDAGHAFSRVGSASLVAVGLRVERVFTGLPRCYDATETGSYGAGFAASQGRYSVPATRLWLALIVPAGPDVLEMRILPGACVTHGTVRVFVLQFSLLGGLRLWVVGLGPGARVDCPSAISPGVEGGGEGDMIG